MIKRSFKQSWPACATAFACALVMAGCSHAVMKVLEANGAMTYVYATSGSGSMLEQICEIFTGGSVIALVAIGGIAGALIAALLAVAGVMFARSRAAEEGASALSQFVVMAVWMLVATLVIVAVFAIVFMGTISDVQLRSVSSKLGHGGSGASLMPVLMLLMIWTLLLMGVGAVYAAIATVKRADGFTLGLGVRLLIAAAVIGILQVFLGANMFMQFNVKVVDYNALNAWIGAGIGLNALVAAAGLFLSLRLPKPQEAEGNGPAHGAAPSVQAASRP